MTTERSLKSKYWEYYEPHMTVFDRLDYAVRTIDFYIKTNTNLRQQIVELKTENSKYESIRESTIHECMGLVSDCSGKLHPDDVICMFKEHFGIVNE